MRKVVIDTNVYVSSFWKNSPPSKILDLVEAKKLKPFVSKPILEEVEEVLLRVIKTEWKVRAFLDLICEVSEMVTIKTILPPLIQDPSDTKFLECAISGRASCVISGDKHLLVLNTFENIPILTPKEFLEQF